MSHPGSSLMGDCIDPRAYSFPLIKTRIDAFFDMLEIRKRENESNYALENKLKSKYKSSIYICNRARDVYREYGRLQEGVF